MHLLVIRTSSMGDVALTVPVIRSLRKQYPEIRVTLLTRSAFIPFFNSIPGLKLYAAAFEERHKGFTGIIRLFRDLNKNGEIDFVIDLHDVIRSKILRWLFRLSGRQTAVIDKGRAQKKELISGGKKVHLKHSVERYLDVFSAAGLHIRPEYGPGIIPEAGAFQKISGLIDGTGKMNIGIAPYSKHKLKMWPEDNMVRLIEMISQKHGVKFWLFGGKEEYEQLSALQSRIPGSYLAAGRLSLDEELALISRLDFMISMDSANMHLAALTGVKVISIWGATDPLAGFGAWGQPDEYAIRIPVGELTCRPCSIYGKGICRRHDLACLNLLTPEKVYNEIINMKII